MNAPPLVSLVIPFRDEATALQELLPLLVTVLDHLADWRFEVLLVNDCSSDASPALVRELAARDPRFQLLELPTRGGQTGAFRLAFAAARGEYIMRMDADMQDDPRDIPLLLEKAREGAMMVLGVRNSRKHSRLLRLAAGIYNLIILLVTNSPLLTNTGSFILFRSPLMREIPFRPNDHRYLPMIALRRGADPVAEVFVRHHPRHGGSSKYRSWKKVMLGLPEVVLFLIRLKMGVYDVRSADRS